MSTLHLVFPSPHAGSALADALRIAAGGDAVLFLQDGVYACAAQVPAAQPLLREAAANGVALYALVPDVDARGLAGRLHPGIGLVDDNGFVGLTERFPRTLSWF